MNRWRSVSYAASQQRDGEKFESVEERSRAQREWQEGEVK
jgi:hypothetical protein